MALQALQRDIQTRLHDEAIGTEVEVLVDTVSRRREAELSGRTMGNTVVNFRAPADTPPEGTSWIGQTVKVRIGRGGPHILSGEAINAD